MCALIMSAYWLVKGTLMAPVCARLGHRGGDGAWWCNRCGANDREMEKDIRRERGAGVQQCLMWVDQEIAKLEKHYEEVQEEEAFREFTQMEIQSVERIRRNIQRLLAESPCSDDYVKFLFR